MPWSRYPRRVRRRGSLSIALLSAVALTGACARPDHSSSAQTETAGAAAPAPVQAAALDLRSQGAPPLAPRAMRITVETTVVVGAFDPAMQRLRTAVEEHGGYVSEARLHGGSDRSATLEARIPSARVGAFRAVVASVGEVVADAEKAEDVTEQRADIGARLRNARAQEKRLLDLLSDRTGSLADVVAVEKQLGGVRETIEQIEAQERLLEGQIAYATVKVSVVTRHEEQAVGAGGKIAAAARNGIENAGAFVVNVAVLLATAGPTLLLLAAIGAILYYALRGPVRRRAAARPRGPSQAGPTQPYPSAPPAHGLYGAPPAYGPPPAHGPQGTHGPHAPQYGPQGTHGPHAPQHGPQGTHGPHAPPVAEAAYGGAQDPHAQQATPPPHAQQTTPPPHAQQTTPPPHAQHATPPPHGPPAEQGPHALRTTPPPEGAHGGGGEAGAG
ncbi:MAG TPA: DUF4349 domain-containing protein [Sorangium sp.]|nr:DUF4349 domain-containing protein [Sorangium sp.]